MASSSRKVIQLAVPVMILLIAIVRFANEGGSDGPWITILGVLVGVLVVVLLFAFAVLLTRRRRLRATPLLEEVRRTGATAYLCFEPMDAHVMIVAVDKAHQLTIFAVDGSKLRQRIRLDAGSYQLREGAVALDLVASTQGLVVEQFGSDLISLHVRPDDGREIGDGTEQQQHAHEAREALIKASR